MQLFYASYKCYQLLQFIILAKKAAHTAKEIKLQMTLTLQLIVSAVKLMYLMKLVVMNKLKPLLEERL